MTTPPLSSETLHATAVAIGRGDDARAVLLVGRPGSGKSDLALRLIDRGAALVSDDYTVVRRPGRAADRLIASAPPTIVGQMEIRGLGIVELEPYGDCPVALVVILDEAPERLPDRFGSRVVAGVAVPTLKLDPFAASAPIKVERALTMIPRR